MKKNQLLNVNILFLNFYIILYIVYISKKITKVLNNNELFGINLYEIRITEDLIKDIQLLKSFLYECTCALFLFDSTESDDFELIKNLIITINEILSNNKNEHFPPLAKIIINNKIDLEVSRLISTFDVKNFLESNKDILNFDLSLKTGQNYNELFNKIIQILTNSNKNMIISQLPCHLISEAKLLVNSDDYTKNNLICVINCILIGDSEVGKSSFLNRYFNNKFCEEFLSTIGVDKETKHIKIKNNIYKITVWDTAGQERFRSLSSKYYKNADGVLIFFDVTKRESFKNVDIWFNEVKQNAKLAQIPVYLIGNKIDLPDRQISQEEANNRCKTLGMKYFEISCKINMNICEVINRMILDCYLTVSGHAQKLKIKTNRKKVKCC